MISGTNYELIDLLCEFDEKDYETYDDEDDTEYLDDSEPIIVSQKELDDIKNENTYDEMTYDEASSTITFNVTKKGGYTIESKFLKLEPTVKCVKFTGESLTFITDGTQNAFDFDSSSVDVVVNNNLDIHVTNRVDLTINKTALVAHKITIGETGCLRCSNYKYGITTTEDIDVNGELDVSGVTSAIYYYSSTNNGKYVNVASGRNLYIQEVKKTLTDSHILEKDCGKHLAICKSSTDIADFISCFGICQKSVRFVNERVQPRNICFFVVRLSEH